MSELSYNGEDALKIGVYRTCHTSAQEAYEDGAMHGFNSIANLSLSIVEEMLAGIDAVREASGASGWFAVGIETRNGWSELKGIDGLYDAHHCPVRAKAIA